MTTDHRIAWGVALADGVLVLAIATAVGRFENGDHATTPSFGRALPYAVAALTPLAIWLGRCHALALQRGTFVLHRVLAVGAVSSVGLLLALALGPLLTPDGRAQFVRAWNAPHGVANTAGEFLELGLSTVFYAAIGMVAALGAAGINWLIVYCCTGTRPRSA